MRFRPLHGILIACLAAGLAGCSGGGDSGSNNGGGTGGGQSQSPSSGVRKLGGVITIAPTSAVDSDSNDIKQRNYKSNDTVATAQSLVAPVLLVGTVNKPDTGPVGNNRSSGDQNDIFKLDLVAGQTVELNFSSDPRDSDVDLYLSSADASVIGVSEGEDTRFECVTVLQSATYYVMVSAFRSASIYNLSIGAPGAAGACAQRTQPASAVDGQLIAIAHQSSESASMKALDTAELRRKAAIDQIDQGGGIELLRLPAAGSTRTRASKALDAATATTAHDLGLPELISTYRFAKQLRASGLYRIALPNLLRERSELTGTFPPNDRNYSAQRWHYEQISLPAAMARISALPNQPAQRPLVAVIDDGVALDHPDLRAQFFSPGRAFVSRSAEGDQNAVSAENISRAADQPVFHGTHVSGTVAASTFDGIGGAGVAPMAQLLPVRVFPARGGATLYDMLQGILYAAGLPNNSGTTPPRRADVINLSMGGGDSCSGAEQQVIDQARAAGVIIVAASGNDAKNDRGIGAPVGSPADCRGVIAVSATDARKGLAFYANTGPAITVAAPGGDPRQSSTGTGLSDQVYSDLATFDSSGRRQPSFGPMSGTSMASPHVAGVMALMKYVNPALTPAQVDALFSAGRLTDELGSAGRDSNFGWGLINAAKAVEAALGGTSTEPPPPPENAGQIVATPSSLDFGGQTNASFDLSAGGTQTQERVVSVSSDSPGVTVTPVAVDPNTLLGRYTVNIDRAALNGNRYPSLTVNLTPARSFKIQLVAPAAGQDGAAVGADFGPIYVLLIDPATDEVVDQVLATWAGGRYTWSHSGYDKAEVVVVAGGDTDNDDLICSRGEPCGGYPVLQNNGEPTPIQLTRDRTDLDFSVAPLSGASTNSVGSARRVGWRKGAR